MTLARTDSVTSAEGVGAEVTGASTSAAVTGAAVTSAGVTGAAVPDSIVRRAGLIDVTAVARLLHQDLPVVDLDGNGVPDELRDPEHASSATRLVLSHGILEKGEIWVLERGGVLHAASVWMPPEVPSFETELHEIIMREIGDSPLEDVPDDDPLLEAQRQSLEIAVPALVDALGSIEPRLLLVATAVSHELEGPDRLEALAAVLSAAGAMTEGPESDPRPVLTAVIDTARVELMRSLGFVEHASIPVGEHGILWIGTRTA